MDLGYYFVDSSRTGMGHYTDEVKGYTNITYSGAGLGLDSERTPGEYRAELAAHFGRITAGGLRSVLDFGGGREITFAATVDTAAPYWESVKYLVYDGDASVPSASQLDAKILSIKNYITQSGLAQKPFGIVFDGPNMAGSGDWMNAPELDFIGIEAYPWTLFGEGGINELIDRVRSNVAKLKSQVPATKNLAMVFPAYTQSGNWERNGFSVDPDLIELQRQVYLMCHEDTRVLSMWLFSYSRTSGTRDNPLLKPIHRQIWEALQGNPNPQPPPDPTPSPEPAQCVRLPNGGQFEQQFFTAQGLYIMTAPPDVIDPDNRNHIFNAVPYMIGIRDTFNANNPSLKAEVEPGQDGRQMMVKSRIGGGTPFSEHYKCWSGGGDETYVRYLYAATCTPPPFDF